MFFLIQDLIQTSLHSTSTMTKKMNFWSSVMFCCWSLPSSFRCLNCISYVEIKSLILSGASSTWNFFAALSTLFFPSPTPAALFKHSFYFFFLFFSSCFCLLLQAPSSLNILTSKSLSISTEPFHSLLVSASYHQLLPPLWPSHLVTRKGSREQLQHLNSIKTNRSFAQMFCKILFKTGNFYKPKIIM